mmetsp:Transcript_35977/g.49950  ORF Transcript_35977/g.49950 Transcript_35977/m.49950 type:complete len:164 (+) Transcript_35977:80-571(+)|eukprot:CAMPEP_0196571288 /NCGR_PEP_ID=MMETSP1081-20130531/1457_1 /TAXON_ID=36882 /ORGANISM="Pyramimonas amylifera, Strain CCMP720" /LENGTH=163 /DNA_ID=CAMNT_0041888165 /DNA_START=86 /DNA_END=577 /DNA_ORIENTATION=-
MPNGHGIRARTRDLFSKGFRKKGVIALSTYLRSYKVGDYVDIKCDPAVQKGMPYKVYHGRTGVIWNISKRSVGVEINKQVGIRVLKKRIHCRVEHVAPSRCREEFLNRRNANDEKKKAAKAAGQKVVTKRYPAVPRDGFTLEAFTADTITAIPYDIVREGVKM